MNDQLTHSVVIGTARLLVAGMNADCDITIANSFIFNGLCMNTVTAVMFDRMRSSFLDTVLGVQVKA